MIRYNLKICYINESFLDEGLLDEISILIGSGIDGMKWHLFLMVLQ